MKTKRSPMYENDQAKEMNMPATCNACDRIIYEDENDQEEFSNDGRGYCSECRQDADEPEGPDSSDIIIAEDGSKYSAGGEDYGHIGQAIEWDDIKKIVKDYCKKINMSPSIWHESDHGNLSIISDFWNEDGE